MALMFTHITHEKLYRSVRLLLARARVFWRSIRYNIGPTRQTNGIVALLMVMGLPLLMAGSYNITHMMYRNQAYAARAAEGGVMHAALAPARAHHARLMGSVLKDNPGKLLGLSGSDLILVLGTPGLAREEGGTSVWQYRAQSCVLDVFLASEEGRTGDTLHYEMRQRQKASVVNEPGPQQDLNENQEKACMQNLLTYHDGREMNLVLAQATAP